jgi:hypothetical protein
MEGGRELRAAKLAELRRQLLEQEQAATPFKPTNFAKKDRYPEVRAVCVYVGAMCWCVRFASM